MPHNSAFIRFEGTNKKLDDRISLTKSSNIGLPTVFYTKEAIQRFSYCVLFFDPIEEMIAIHFTNDSSESGIFKVIHDKRGKGATISAKSFFKSIKIDPKYYHGRYKWRKGMVDEAREAYIFQPYLDPDEIPF